MCGIAGFWTLRNNAEAMQQDVRRMTQAIRHRGPDDEGHWVDSPSGIALGHRRLSILDLSRQGHQPMISPGGRYCITYNGEIYNFRELRRQLQGVKWRGTSDTEVMLAAFEAWGLEATIQRFVGMFAFALFDRQERQLHLVRDRVGIKPLYYGFCGDTFFFASELKSLRAHSDFQPIIDRSSLALLLRYNYIPHPYSIFRGISKLPPGTILSINSPQSELIPRPFWCIEEVAAQSERDPFRGTDQQAITATDELLRQAVSLRMIADVPLGALLSGGIDSSLVVALMQAQSTRPVKTFTVGFVEGNYNESDHAGEVARHLRTEHTDLLVRPEEAMTVIPKLGSLYDEPFADSSQVPTLLVSQLARRHVTVTLSGDGGDELFCGYTRYLLGDGAWQMVYRIPRPLRAGAAKSLQAALGVTSPDGFARVVKKVPWMRRRGLCKSQVEKLARSLQSADFDQAYRNVMSHWLRPEEVVLGAVPPATAIEHPERGPKLADQKAKMMYLDFTEYLPGDILAKVDRASMAASLEARVPLLDHRVVEFAWRLPMHLKIRNGTQKWLLKQVLYKYVPRELVERPKKGFAIPVGQWLRGPLRDWAESLLSEARLRNEGFLRPRMVREVWADHLAARGDREHQLWAVLSFQMWLQSHSEWPAARDVSVASVSG
jgi:asparagine synthase (glutamine-hydrolysing)